MQLPEGKIRHWVVAIYDQGRSYGGPEEGGWWFTEGELSQLDSVHGTEEAAYEAALCFNEAARAEGVATSGGEGLVAHVVQVPRMELHPQLRGQECHLFGDEITDDDYVIEWNVPLYFPEGRPHYC